MDAYVQVSPDVTAAGPLVDTSELVIDGETVNRQRIVIADPTSATGVAAVAAATPASTASGLVTRPVPADFDQLVAAGLVTGMTVVNKFGANLDVDTGTTPEDVWSRGATWVAPTAARIHAIVSTSIADDVGSTGATSVRIHGLASWAAKETSEDVILDGTTPVNTVGSYVIIHRMKCLTFGAGKINAGVISATAAVDATVTAEIAIGDGQTTMAIYGIPSIQAAYITQYYLSTNRAVASGSVDVKLAVNETPDVANGGFLNKHRVGVSIVGTSYLAHPFKPYFKIAGPAIIKLTVTDVSANDSDVSGGFDLILVDN